MVEPGQRQVRHQGTLRCSQTKEGVQLSDRSAEVGGSAMATSIPGKPQSKGARPRSGHMVGVRLHQPELAALDSFRADQGPELTRAGAVRLLLVASLQELGRLKPE